MRNRAKVAKHIQIRMLVGRSIQAKAASNRQRRILFPESAVCSMQSHKLITYIAFSSPSLCSPFVRRPSLSISPSSSASVDHCQGQKFSATTVKDVSRQLESVRVEQNHCQGLQTVRASYRIRDTSNQLAPRLVQRYKYWRYIQLPMLHYCLIRRHVPQASMCSDPLPQRRWPGSPLAPLLEGRRGMWKTDAGPRRDLRTAYTRRQRLQDVLQNVGDFSTPAPALSNHRS